MLVKCPRVSPGAQPVSETLDSFFTLLVQSEQARNSVRAAVVLLDHNKAQVVTNLAILFSCSPELAGQL